VVAALPERDDVRHHRAGADPAPKRKILAEQNKLESSMRTRVVIGL
jgi:hypothetical protein